MLGLIILSTLFFVLDIYAYQAIKTLSPSIWLRFSLLGISLLITILTFYIFSIDREAFSIPTSNLITGVFLMLLLAKMVLIAFMFGEDIIRFIQGIFKTHKEVDDTFLPSRRKFISQLALGIAAIPFSSLLLGMLVGKYNFKVLKYELYFDDLPDAFDGYQLTHLSDLHCGSFDNSDKIEYAIQLVNDQASDAIMLTGDLVNMRASEILPWKTTLARLNAKDGVYSVLGNHDYGHYVQWDTEEDERQNFAELKALQEEMGFKLLLNDHHFIEKDNERITIVGVENWGTGFVQKGDLDKASAGMNDKDFSIVMSHDPTHWEEKILTASRHYHLTLSGHTHGMQFGIEIPGWIKWSPAKWRYKQWAGIYEKGHQYINVNRGFGFLAFPGRTGIWPEITVITLRKK